MFSVGEYGITNRNLASFAAEIAKGTKVKIVAVNPNDRHRMYSIEDEHGTRLTECDMRYIDKMAEDEKASMQINNVYRVWFDSTNGPEVCCILVAAPNEKRALELAREAIKDFPDLKNAQYQISVFDTSTEKASIC